MAVPDNPFSVLTILVAPAILTNATSILINGTSLRFARVVDRFRLLKASQPDAAGDDRESVAWEQRVAGRRALLLVRALTAFYVALGAFALTTFLALAGALLLEGGMAASRGTMVAAVAAGGVGGVGALIVGASFLVTEVWLAHGVLKAEAARIEATQ
jgi:Protein of unknown function (DUF2721)